MFFPYFNRSLLVLFGVVVIASTSYDMIKLRSSEKPDSKGKWLFSV